MTGMLSVSSLAESHSSYKVGTLHLGLEIEGLYQTMIPKPLSIPPRVGGSNPEETFCIAWDVSISGILPDTIIIVCDLN